MINFNINNYSNNTINSSRKPDNPDGPQSGNWENFDPESGNLADFNDLAHNDAELEKNVFYERDEALQNEALDFYYRFGDILSNLKIKNPKYAFSPLEGIGFRKMMQGNAKGKTGIGIAKALRSNQRIIFQKDPALRRNFGDIGDGANDPFEPVLLGGIQIEEENPEDNKKFKATFYVKAVGEDSTYHKWYRNNNDPTNVFNTNINGAHYAKITVEIALDQEISNKTNDALAHKKVSLKTAIEDSAGFKAMQKNDPTFSVKDFIVKKVSEKISTKFEKFGYEHSPFADEDNTRGIFQDALYGDIWSIDDEEELGSYTVEGVVKTKDGYWTIPQDKLNDFWRKEHDASCQARNEIIKTKNENEEFTFADARKKKQEKREEVFDKFVKEGEKNATEIKDDNELKILGNLDAFIPGLSPYEVETTTAVWNESVEDLLKANKITKKDEGKYKKCQLFLRRIGQFYASARALKRAIRFLSKDISERSRQIIGDQLTDDGQRTYVNTLFSSYQKSLDALTKNTDLLDNAKEAGLIEENVFPDGDAFRRELQKTDEISSSERKILADFLAKTEVKDIAAGSGESAQKSQTKTAAEQRKNVASQFSHHIVYYDNSDGRANVVNGEKLIDFQELQKLAEKKDEEFAGKIRDVVVSDLGSQFLDGNFNPQYTNRVKRVIRLLPPFNDDFWQEKFPQNNIYPFLNGLKKITDQIQIQMEELVSMKKNNTSQAAFDGSGELAILQTTLMKIQLLSFTLLKRWANAEKNLKEGEKLSYQIINNDRYHSPDLNDKEIDTKNEILEKIKNFDFLDTTAYEDFIRSNPNDYIDPDDMKEAKEFWTLLQKEKPNHRAQTTNLSNFCKESMEKLNMVRKGTRGHQSNLDKLIPDPTFIKPKKNNQLFGKRTENSVLCDRFNNKTKEDEAHAQDKEILAKKNLSHVICFHGKPLAELNPREQQQILSDIGIQPGDLTTFDELLSGNSSLAAERLLDFLTTHPRLLTDYSTSLTFDHPLFLEKTNTSITDYYNTATNLTAVLENALFRSLGDSETPLLDEELNKNPTALFSQLNNLLATVRGSCNNIHQANIQAFTNVLCLASRIETRYHELHPEKESPLEKTNFSLKNRLNLLNDLQQNFDAKIANKTNLSRREKDDRFALALAFNQFMVEDLKKHPDKTFENKDLVRLIRNKAYIFTQQTIASVPTFLTDAFYNSTIQFEAYWLNPKNKLQKIAVAKELAEEVRRILGPELKMSEKVIEKENSSVVFFEIEETKRAFEDNKVLKIQIDLLQGDFALGSKRIGGGQYAFRHTAQTNLLFKNDLEIIGNIDKSSTAYLGRIKGHIVRHCGRNFNVITEEIINYNEDKDKKEKEPVFKTDITFSYDGEDLTYFSPENFNELSSGRCDRDKNAAKFINDLPAWARSADYSIWFSPTGDAYIFDNEDFSNPIAYSRFNEEKDGRVYWHMNPEKRPLTTETGESPEGIQSEHLLFYQDNKTDQVNSQTMGTIGTKAINDAINAFENIGYQQRFCDKESGDFCRLRFPRYGMDGGKPLELVYEKDVPKSGSVGGAEKTGHWRLANDADKKWQLIDPNDKEYQEFLKDHPNDPLLEKALVFRNSDPESKGADFLILSNQDNGIVSLDQPKEKTCPYIRSQQKDEPDRTITCCRPLARIYATKESSVLNPEEFAQTRFVGRGRKDAMFLAGKCLQRFEKTDATNALEEALEAMNQANSHHFSPPSEQDIYAYLDLVTLFARDELKDSGDPEKIKKEAQALIYGAAQLFDVVKPDSPCYYSLIRLLTKQENGTSILGDLYIKAGLSGNNQQIDPIIASKVSPSTLKSLMLNLRTLSEVRTEDEIDTFWDGAGNNVDQIQKWEDVIRENFAKLENESKKETILGNEIKKFNESVLKDLISTENSDFKDIIKDLNEIPNSSKKEALQLEESVDENDLLANRLKSDIKALNEELKIGQNRLQQRETFLEKHPILDKNKIEGLINNVKNQQEIIKKQRANIIKNWGKNIPFERAMKAFLMVDHNGQHDLYRICQFLYPGKELENEQLQQAKEVIEKVANFVNADVMDKQLAILKTNLEALKGFKDNNSPSAKDKWIEIETHLAELSEVKNEPLFLVCAYVTGNLPRPQQVVAIKEIINAAFSENEGDRAILKQLLMGSGKSKYMMPFLTLLISQEKTKNGRRKIPLIVSHRSQMATIAGDLKKSLGEEYAMNLKTVQFNSQALSDINQLEGLRDDLRKAAMDDGGSGTAFLLESGTVEALYVTFNRLSQQVIDGRFTSEARQAAKKKLVLLTEIFDLMKQDGIGIFDEVDKTLSPRESYITPHGGDSQHLDDQDVNLVRDVFFQLSQDPNYGDKLAKGELKNLTPQAMEDLMESLADQMLNGKKFDDIKNFFLPGDLKNFLLGKDDQLGKQSTNFSENLNKLAGEKARIHRELCLLRGLITNYLPKAFSQSYNENFGYDRDGKCVPYKGPNEPSTNVFKDPYEALCKTFCCVAMDPTNNGGVKSSAVALYLKEACAKTSSANNWDQANKEFEAKFGKILESMNPKSLKLSDFAPPSDGCTVEEQKAWQEKIVQFTTLLNTPGNAELKWNFAAQEGQSKISFNSATYEGKSTPLPNLFSAAVAFSGTISNANAYSSVLNDKEEKKIADKGAIGQIFNKIGQDINDGKAQILIVEDSQTPEDLFSKLKNKNSKSENIALIDAGAFMKYSKAQTVARDMLKATPTLPGMVYFDPDNRKFFFQGQIDPKKNDKNFPDPQELATTDLNELVEKGIISKEDAAKCGAYFDQPRTTGTDFKFPPDAHFWVTVDPAKTTIDSFAQAALRARQLLGGQKMDIVIFKSSQDKIVTPSGKNFENLEDNKKWEAIVATLQRNSTEEIVQQEIQGAVDKLDDLMRSFVQKKQQEMIRKATELEASGKTSEANKIWDLQNALVEEADDFIRTQDNFDPAVIFGSIQKRETATNYLNAILEKKMERLNAIVDKLKNNCTNAKLELLEKNEIDEIRKAGEKIIDKAPDIYMIINDNQDSTNTNNNGKEVEVEVQQERDKDLQRIQSLEVGLESEVANPYNEEVWNFNEPGKDARTILENKTKTISAVISNNETNKAIGHPPYNDFKNCFPSYLKMTDNFRISSENYADVMTVFNDMQKPAMQMLLTWKDNKFEVVLVSNKDAEEMREAINNGNLTNCQLYNSNGVALANLKNGNPPEGIDKMVQKAIFWCDVFNGNVEDPTFLNEELQKSCIQDLLNEKKHLNEHDHRDLVMNFIRNKNSDTGKVNKVLNNCNYLHNGTNPINQDEIKKKITKNGFAKIQKKNIKTQNNNNRKTKNRNTDENNQNSKNPNENFGGNEQPNPQINEGVKNPKRIEEENYNKNENTNSSFGQSGATPPRFTRPKQTSEQPVNPVNRPLRQMKSAPTSPINSTSTAHYRRTHSLGAPSPTHFAYKMRTKPQKKISWFRGFNIQSVFYMAASVVLGGLGVAGILFGTISIWAGIAILGLAVLPAISSGVAWNNKLHHMRRENHFLQDSFKTKDFSAERW